MMGEDDIEWGLQNNSWLAALPERLIWRADADRMDQMLTEGEIERADWLEKR